MSHKGVLHVEENVPVFLFEPSPISFLFIFELYWINFYSVQKWSESCKYHRLILSFLAFNKILQLCLFITMETWALCVCVSFSNSLHILNPRDISGLILYQIKRLEVKFVELYHFACVCVCKRVFTFITEFFFYFRLSHFYLCLLIKLKMVLENESQR